MDKMTALADYYTERIQSCFRSKMEIKIDWIDNTLMIVFVNPTQSLASKTRNKTLKGIILAMKDFCKWKFDVDFIGKQEMVVNSYRFDAQNYEFSRRPQVLQPYFLFNKQLNNYPSLN